MLVISEEFGHQFANPLFFFDLSFMEDTREIDDFVLWLVKVGYHVNQLWHDTKRLLDILLYKPYHLRPKVVLDSVNICEWQAQTFHVIDTLHCEHSAW